MDHHPSLYDRDILTWSEEQAALLRRLAAIRRDLPNELDLDNIVEEIESVGRSELAAVESNLVQMLLHLIKLANDPNGLSAPHWRSEIIAFQSNAQRRFTPSMASRINMEDLWRDALRRVRPLLADRADAPTLPQSCPFTLEELLGDETPDRLSGRIIP